MGNRGVARNRSAGWRPGRAEVLAMTRRLHADGPQTLNLNGGVLRLVGPTATTIARALNTYAEKVLPDLLALVADGELRRVRVGAYGCYVPSPDREEGASTGSQRGRR